MLPAQTTKQMSRVVSHIIRPLSKGWHRIRFVVDFRKGQNHVINWRVRVVEHDDPQLTVAAVGAVAFGLHATPT